MNDETKYLRLKQVLLRFALFVWVIALVGCGTPHSESLKPEMVNIAGSHVAGAFSIKRVQLDMNGRSSKTIKINESLSPRAVIKYQGSGVFQAQWLLNDQVVEQVNSVLNRGSLLTLNSKTIKMPIIGRHVIRLKIIQPIVNFKTPELKVFVAQ